MKSALLRSVLALATIGLVAGMSAANAQQKDRPLKKYESGTKEFWTHPPDDWFLGDETEAQKGLAPPSGPPTGASEAELAALIKKIKLPSGFKKSLVLFNLHRAAARGQTTVVVVEGFFDCMKVHQAGWRNVVALMGASMSAEQERLLMERFTRIVLLLDGDAAGRSGSTAIAARLAGKCSVQDMQLSSARQPDQLDAEEIQKLLEFPGSKW